MLRAGKRNSDRRGHMAAVELEEPVGLRTLCAQCGEWKGYGDAECILCAGEPPISEQVLFRAWCELWLEGQIDSLGRVTAKGYGLDPEG